MGLVGASANGGNVAVLTGASGVVWPSVVARGNFALLFWNTVDTAGRTLPPGFTQLGGIANKGTLNSGLYIKPAIGNEDGNEVGLECTGGTATNRQTALLLVYDDILEVDSFKSVNEPGTLVTTHANPAVTPGVANSKIITAYCERLTTGTTTITAPTGYTKRAENGTSGSGGTFIAGADDGLTLGRAAGASVTPPPWTNSVAATNAIMWTVALKPMLAQFGVSL